MTELASVQRSWLSVIRYAIDKGEADVAYRLTVGFVRRLRQMTWRAA